METPIKVRVAVLLGATDLQGKAYLTNMTQHNGESGCITCEEPGVIVAQGNGHTRCYPYKSSLEKAPSRTTKTLLEQALRASQTQKRVTFTSICMYKVCQEKATSILKHNLALITQHKNIKDEPLNGDSLNGANFMVISQYYIACILTVQFFTVSN